jgi:hypothetical protein
VTERRSDSIRLVPKFTLKFSPKGGFMNASLCGFVPLMELLDAEQVGLTPGKRLFGGGA